VRELGVRMKHSANRAAIEGKRIILIDDSLVRAPRSKKIVRMMPRCGAREVHFRLASPRSCIPTITASTCRTAAAFSLATHSLERCRHHRRGFAGVPVDRRMYPRHGRPGRDPQSKFSDHCFTGAYPTHRRTRPRSSRSPGNGRCWRKQADRPPAVVPA